MTNETDEVNVATEGWLNAVSMADMAQEWARPDEIWSDQIKYVMSQINGEAKRGEFECTLNKHMYPKLFSQAFKRAGGWKLMRLWLDELGYGYEFNNGSSDLDYAVVAKPHIIIRWYPK